MEGTLKQQLPYASIFLRYFMLKLRRRKKITYFVVNRIEKNFFFFLFTINYYLEVAAKGNVD